MRSKPVGALKALLLTTAICVTPIGLTAFSAVEANVQDKFAPLYRVYEQVKDNYVDPVEDDQLVEGAIAGLLGSLDPHSAYLDKSDFESLMIQVEGEYGGLGLQVTSENDAVKVIAPFDGTPAARAGIKAGDYITHLDGQLIVGLKLDEAVQRMRGKPGTPIKLTIVRQGRDMPFDVDITREVISLEPVDWEVRDNVGVIRISGFSRHTGRDTLIAIKKIQQQLGPDLDGFILDLRSNPGGALDQALFVSDIFLEGGEIVSERGRHKENNRSFKARPGDFANGKPVIVLLDAGSASASEIVAGALQDHGRALVMGERSFGKGSVQNIINLTEDTGLRLTISRYYTPSGRSVQEGGITPDIRVPQISDPDYDKRPVFREADLLRHLVNEKALDDEDLMTDSRDDPRFDMTAEQLKEQGIEDFQLHYALEALKRGDAAPRKQAASG